MRAPRFLAAKSIFCWFFTGAWRVFDSLPSMASPRPHDNPLPLSFRLQIALILSFNMAPWKWVWHHQEGVTMTCRGILEMTCASCTLKISLVQIANFKSVDLTQTRKFIISRLTKSRVCHVVLDSCYCCCQCSPCLLSFNVPHIMSDAKKILQS